MSTTRRPKWHPTPPRPPSPKVLNFPRRTRRKQSKNTTTTKPSNSTQTDYRGKLESLFDQERVFSRTVPIVVLNSSERRERVEEEEEEREVEENGGFVEDKWGFQAEILRAECYLLRMEREFALKKLERNRVQMERTLRSAVQILVSGREKICEGKNVSATLEEEIEDLAEKLEKLQRSSGVRDFEVPNCSNFDKQASLLQRRLEKLGGLLDEKCVMEIQDPVESSLSNHTTHEIDNESFDLGLKSPNRFADKFQVGILGKKIEGLSNRMEEQSMFSTTANSSGASYSSTSRRIEFLDSSSSAARQLHRELLSHGVKKCSGHCKGVLRRIVEQVRMDTEQWSQMQAMLGQVRGEMEELQASRDFWENQAIEADHEIQSLRSAVKEWKQKAVTFQNKANELHTEISALSGELEKLRIAENKKITTQDLPPVSAGKQLGKEKHVLHCHLKDSYHTNAKQSKQEIETLKMEQNREMLITKDLPTILHGKQIEKEKCALICLKENYHPSDEGSKQDILRDGRQKAKTCGNGLVALKRCPFQDIGNSA